MGGASGEVIPCWPYTTGSLLRIWENGIPTTTCDLQQHSNIQINNPNKQQRPRIIVVGAGIIGVTTAFRISETFKDVDITIVAEKFPPNTTSDGVAGLWTPYLCGNEQNSELLHHWSKETYDYWQEVNVSADAYKMGICKLNSTYLKTIPEELPMWKDIVESFQKLDEKNYKRYGAQYCGGVTYTAFTAEPKKLSPFLLKKFLKNGGKFRHLRVKNLQEFLGLYDIAINCTGVEAQALVTDSQLHPIRGQVMRVKAPFIKTCIMDDDNYILPCQNSVLLGGTHQYNDWNLKVDNGDSNHIWTGCCRLMPSLQDALIINEWVGLRPGRSTVRLEMETLRNDNEQMQVIHNYGHGGSGVTLCWGCAGDILDILSEHFRSRQSLLPAKL